MKKSMFLALMLSAMAVGGAYANDAKPRGNGDCCGEPNRIKVEIKVSGKDDCRLPKECDCCCPELRVHGPKRDFKHPRGHYKGGVKRGYAKDCPKCDNAPRGGYSDFGKEPHKGPHNGPGRPMPKGDYGHR